jgi:hypothetical protein
MGEAVRQAVDLVEGQALVAEQERRPVAMMERAAADQLGDQHRPSPLPVAMMDRLRSRWQARALPVWRAGRKERRR